MFKWHIPVRNATWWPPNIRILKFVVGPFGLDSILLTEGSVLDPQH